MWKNHLLKRHQFRTKSRDRTSVLKKIVLVFFIYKVHYSFTLSLESGQCNKFELEMIFGYEKG